MMNLTISKDFVPWGNTQADLKGALFDLSFLPSLHWPLLQQIPRFMHWGISQTNTRVDVLHCDKYIFGIFMARKISITIFGTFWCKKGPSCLSTIFGIFWFTKIFALYFGIIRGTKRSTSPLILKYWPQFRRFQF